MNIFYLDKDPVKSAQYSVDKHTGSKNEGGKMIVEAAQMIASAYSLERLAAMDCPRTQKNTPRKHSYFNHPCTKWARKNQTNFDWVVRYGLAMVEEKIYRGGKEHFSATFIKWADKNRPDIQDDPLTKPALAMPEEYHNEDSVQAYRDYYFYDKFLGKITKSIPMNWTRRPKPDWINEYA